MGKHLGGPSKIKKKTDNIATQKYIETSYLRFLLSVPEVIRAREGGLLAGQKTFSGRMARRGFYLGGVSLILVAN